MLRIKMLLGFVLVTCALAVSAMPASALIKGTSGNVKGQLKAGESTFEGGGAGFKCITAEGTWAILKATGSTTEKLNVVKWNKCTATKPALFAGLSVTVSECSFTLEQPLKGIKVTGGKAKVESSCVINAPQSCVVTVPKTAANEGLLEWSGENINSTTDLVKGNVSGITDETNGAPCTTVGVTATTTAIFKAPKVTLFTQNFE
jgi:hypothetical protein